MILHLHDLFPPDKTDEAAAVISTVLHELAFQFDAQYLGEIRRHRDQQPRSVNPSQPWLNPSDDP